MHYCSLIVPSSSVKSLSTRHWGWQLPLSCLHYHDASAADHKLEVTRHGTCLELAGKEEQPSTEAGGAADRSERMQLYGQVDGPRFHG